MKTVAWLLLLGICCYSCDDNEAISERTEIATSERTNSLKHIPFEIQLYDHNYSLAYSLQYILKEESLEIFLLGNLEGEKRELIYKKSLSDDEKSKTKVFVETFSIDSLKTHYSNPCVADGDQKTLLVKIADRQKQVHISNYYQTDIGALIELLNSNAPKKFEINYDKDALRSSMKDCNM